MDDQMRVLKEDTAGVIIDVQEKLYPHIFKNEQLINNLIILLKGLKVLNIPILVTQQYTKGLGPTIQPIKEELQKFSFIEKTSFSCCDEPDFKMHLSKLGKKFVIVTGIEAHVCVLQTTIDLLASGYTPVLIEDCVSSRKEKDKEIAIERMRAEGAIISTYESILFELCRYSEASEFRAITKLVK
jgi:nicotinamidase-related amidase